MKAWQKLKNEDLGKTLFIWRHRATSRFFTKIFTWLLGGFVSGIMTSIFFLAIGLPDLSLLAARIVFFVVFIFGVISAFFRNIYYGNEYRIMEKAVVQITPICGIESIGRILGSADKPFGQKTDFITFEKMKEMKDQENSFIVILKEKGDSLPIGVTPVAGYCNVAENEAPVNIKNLFARDEKLNKTVLKQIVQKSRDAKKAMIQ